VADQMVDFGLKLVMVNSIEMQQWMDLLSSTKHINIMSVNLFDVFDFSDWSVAFCW
jgi:hypothetical protein